MRLALTYRYWCLSWSDRCVLLLLLLQLTSGCDTDESNLPGPDASAAKSKYTSGFESDYRSYEVSAAGTLQQWQQLSLPLANRNHVDQLTDLGPERYQRTSGITPAASGYRFQEPDEDFRADYSSQRYDCACRSVWIYCSHVNKTRGARFRKILKIFVNLP